ncbi:transglycosylase domain-containing protein [Paraurantiacibacter namhicola]|uniref:Penicillin-binding protein 2D n=1 Tax=Paraurantiacibacter namhicola TaxID=645517 RepID=A0A1C7D761_9SPHN|nr:PBP1A family penicillin-binding protein [Paraurantiacibacter namhicola]ANU07133.1 Penicillin-binding protein 2D [Paraurantiacibacter namhicola]
MAQKRGERRRRAAGSGSSAAKVDKPERGFAARWMRRLLVWGTALALLGAIALGTSVYFAAQNLPSYSAMMSSQNGQTIVVRARDGSEIVSLGPSYGQWLYDDEIPTVMKDAIISVEDRRYRSHFGVDVLGLGRAIYNSLTGGGRIRATSTITQQLARNVFLNSNRSMDRKAREMVLAMALEWKFSKEQILELYLNKVYFGGGAYGIDSASRNFYSHSARDLSLEEAAIIAGLVKAPSRYSPTADADAAVSRGNVVLGQMRKYGALSPSDSTRIEPGVVNIKPDGGSNSVRYFTDWALPQLDILLNTDSFEPIEVWTTIDPDMQAAAVQSLRANTPSGTQGALVSIEDDGAILALVGGTNYVESNYNRATDAVRQPGSSWKLFVYLAALEAGYRPDSTVKDVQVTIGDWSPRNSGGGYAGEMDLRSAFAYSKNTVAAQLGNEVGFGTVASMARRFGITTPISEYPSMVLGSSETRVIEMVRAFAGISAGGYSVEPYGITKVTGTNGRVLYERETPRRYQLVPDYVAAGMTDLLQAGVSIGTGRAAQIGRPVAGKTGTTSSNKDGWFVGFSSGVTTGVWMGRDDAKAVPGLQGGRAPAQAFSQFMRVAVKDRPIREFDTDTGLPEWQIEPDDEYLYNDSEDYYFIDEDGNLIEPVGPDRGGRNPLDPDAEPRSGGEGRSRPAPSQPEGPPAASDDFLERAIGGELPADQPPQRRRPAPAAPPPPAPSTGDGQRRPQPAQLP